MTEADRIANLERIVANLTAQNKALVAKANQARGVNLKLTEKGCISLTGGRLRRMGAVFYATEWHTILENAANIKAFIQDNADSISWKNESDAMLFDVDAA